MLGHWPRHFMLCLVLVKARKHPYMTEIIIDWDIKHQLKLYYTPDRSFSVYANRDSRRSYQEVCEPNL